jgi:hypothetical protein
VEPGHTVRCIHAYELPASGAWLEELSRRIDGATRENAANAGHSPDLARDAAAVATELGRAWKRPDRSTAARESTKRPARSRPSHLVVAAMAAVLAIFAVHAAAEHGRRVRAHAMVQALSEQLEARAKLTGVLPERLSELGWRLYSIVPGGVANDPWGHPFSYRVPGSYGRRFDLGSTGADGVPSSDDIGIVAGAPSPKSNGHAPVTK